MVKEESCAREMKLKNKILIEKNVSFFMNIYFEGKFIRLFKKSSLPLIKGNNF